MTTVNEGVAIVEIAATKRFMVMGMKFMGDYCIHKVNITSKESLENILMLQEEELLLLRTEEFHEQS